MTPNPQIQVTKLRSKAFAYAREIAGPGDPARQLLHDLAGMDSLAGQDAAFWSGLADHVQRIARERARKIQPSPRADALPSPAGGRGVGGEGVGCTAKQWNYILALRDQLGMTDDHWRNFLKKQLRIEHERFLTVNKARGAVTGLIKMRDRRKALVGEAPALSPDPSPARGRGENSRAGRGEQNATG